MNKYLYNAVTLFFLLTLTSTHTLAATLTFIHENDLHAHLTPHLDKVVKNGQVVYESRGGIARLATMIKQIRAEQPNSVLMNIGDTYHGGVEALFTNGNAVVDPVNALGVDVGIPGNWDYAYGYSVTQLRYANLTAQETSMYTQMVGMTIQRPAFPNMAANVTYTDTGLPFLPGTMTKVIAGVKVGFIGISSDIVPMMDANLAKNLTFLQGETAYRDLINNLAQTLRSQGASLVVVMSELGIHKDYRLADVINAGSVDVFFSAHTHEKSFTPLQSNSGALVVEGGHDGWLGRMDVTVNPGQKPIFNWRLLAIDSSVAEDAAMKALVDTARAPFLVSNPNIALPMKTTTLVLDRPINQVLGTVYTPVDREQALESTFNDGWTDTLLRKTRTDVAMSPGFRFDAPIPAAGTLYEGSYVANGAITVEDVYRYFPLPLNIATGNTTVSTLKSIISNSLDTTYSLNSFAQGGGWLYGLAGLAVTVDLSKPDGQRLTSVARSNGAALADSTVLTVTGCLRPSDTPSAGILCNQSGFTNIQYLQNLGTGNPYYAQEVMIEALIQGWFQSTPRTSIVDTAKTPAWPSQPFVQPLAVKVHNGYTSTSTALQYNAKKGLYSTTITITNTGTTAITAPTKLVISGVSNQYAVRNASGTYYDQPYLALPGTIEVKGQVSITLQISGPAPTGFSTPSYSSNLYSGGV